MELAERFELSSRPNPGLTGYKPAALPLCYASKLAHPAGLKPASPRLEVAHTLHLCYGRMELLYRLELYFSTYGADASPSMLEKQIW